MTGVGAKDLYRTLCRDEASIPLFHRDWWLDATCGEAGWGVALAEKGDEIIGSLPYAVRRRLGFTLLGMPPLTPALGPWVKHTASGHANRLSREKEVYQALVDDLPPYDRYVQGWHRHRTNWLPFYWKGFQQTTRYTYVLSELSDEESLWSNLRGSVRTDVRKAEQRFGLKVNEHPTLEPFLTLSHKTFQRQGKEQPFSDSIVRRIDQACSDRGCRRILVAEDADGRCHAGAYIVWDDDSAYYLLGGADPELRSSGAASLCLWEAIRFAGQIAQNFDFEGSMIEQIERFFRAFGAVQTPYFIVSSTPSRVLRARSGLASLFNAP